VNLKRILLLGFLPSEIRFFNGNGGDGDMDLAGGFGAQAGGAVSGEGQLGAEPDVPGADIPGGYGEAPSPSPAPDLTQSLFNPEISDYTAPPESSYGTPSPAPGLTQGLFNPEISDYTAPPESSYGTPSPSPAPLGSEWPSESRFVSTWQGIVREVENTLQGMIEARPGQIKDIKHMADTIIYGLLGVIGIAQPEAAPALAGVGLAKGLIEKAGEKTFGQRIAEAAVPEPTFAGAWERHYGFTSPVSPEITVSPDSEAKSEGLSESLFSVPVTQKEPSPYLSTYYAKTGYQPLSLSLFGSPSMAQKEAAGLMIFPSSASGIEKEGSSLLKKQEPLIDTPSLLFLFGMGAVGLVLRKGAKA